MIVIVGSNHGIQPQDEDWLTGDSPEAREQKAGFRGLLEEVFERDGIQLVGEEWGLPERTIAYDVAENHGARWTNINTSFPELDGMRVPRDYVHGKYTQEQKQNWNRQREQVMVRKLNEVLKGAQRVLLICGFDHVDGLAELLRQQGADPRIVNYRELEWFTPGVFRGET